MAQAFAAVVLLAAALRARAQAPTQQGGGPCGSDWDCSLAGLCATNGTCVCDVWSTGPQCDLLNLAPPPSTNFGLQVPSYHSWGGHALPDAAGVWHGFFSFLCNHSTLGSWTTKSAGVHATASAPEGPYTVAEMLVQPWSHNMMISEVPGGPYLLWQIGNAVTPSSKWAPCYEPNSTAAASASASAPGADAEVAPVSVKGSRPFPDAPSVMNGQIYVRSAPSLTGPWTPFANNSGVTIDFSGTWLAANGASGGNPAPFYFENGTTLLYLTGSPCPDGWGNLAPNCIALARADAWDAPLYTLTSPLPLTHPESEDPFTFRDARGNFHLLTNVNTYHARCAAGVPCGGHAWSRDGLTWSNLTIGAFGPVIRVANASDPAGSYWQNAYVERPQVVQAADGTPLTFFVGIGRTSYMDSASWAQPFCQPGQSGCGATHPPPPTVVRYQLGGLCAGTNASFPCPGGWADSCPVFLTSCLVNESLWLEHPDGTLESASQPGQCVNFDCNNCDSNTIAKVVSCKDADALNFTSTAGSLASVTCPGMCLNDGQQAAPANPPCKAGEQYLPHGQLTLQSCGSEGTTGWQRVVQPQGDALPRSARWHYHWREETAQREISAARAAGGQ